MSRTLKAAPMFLATMAVVGGATTAASAGSEALVITTAYSLPEVGSYPEGIAVDPSTKRVYVTSLTDGAIFTSDNSSGTLKTFSPAGADGRTNATGVLAAGKRIFVAGGPTGTLYAYDQSAKLVFLAKTPEAGSFLNDVAINNGYVYVTDSFKPIVWRKRLGSSGESTLEPWIDLSKQGIAFKDKAFNWNGIEPTGRADRLVAVDSATGNLYRVDVKSKKVTQIDLGGVAVTNGDGLVVRGQTVWVVRNSDRTIDTVTMNVDWTQGKVATFVTSDQFGFPTTADIRNGSLLVVNSQFDKGGPAGEGTPTRPFTVSAVALRKTTSGI
jgi:sugar lactone lactonase YvrE